MIATNFPDGDGLFETILTVEQRPQLFIEHIDRARVCAGQLGWKFPPDEEIALEVHAVISDSSHEAHLGRLRIIFTPDGKISASHDPYIQWRWPAKLTISDFPVDETSPLTGVKILPYRRNLELLHSAQQSGFDDALQLNSKSEVAETSIANVIIKINGVWMTPPISCGVLPGIIRGLAVSHLGVQEHVISKEDLLQAESIFLLNSLKGFQPVGSLDGRLLSVETEIMKNVASLSQFRWVG